MSGGAVHVKFRAELPLTGANPNVRIDPQRPSIGLRPVTPRKSIPTRHVPALIRRAIIEGAVQ